MNNVFPTPLLNLSRAQEFATEAEQMRELMATFEQSLVQEMGQLQSALVQGDVEQVRLSLHVLKGFMPLFCEDVFAQAVADLYQQSRQEELAATQATYARLAPELNALLSEVRAWLGHL